jgi:hypothetical protein
MNSGLKRAAANANQNDTPTQTPPKAAVTVRRTTVGRVARNGAQARVRPEIVAAQAAHDAGRGLVVGNPENDRKHQVAGHVAARLAVAVDVEVVQSVVRIEQVGVDGGAQGVRGVEHGRGVGVLFEYARHVRGRQQRGAPNDGLRT